MDPNQLNSSPGPSQLSSLDDVPRAILSRMAWLLDLPLREVMELNPVDALTEAQPVAAAMLELNPAIFPTREPLTFLSVLERASLALNHSNEEVLDAAILTMFHNMQLDGLYAGTTEEGGARENGENGDEVKNNDEKEEESFIRLLRRTTGLPCFTGEVLKGSEEEWERMDQVMGDILGAPIVQAKDKDANPAPAKGGAAPK